jgi:RNA polymerase sigma-70 factor (sigma-E family)
MRSGETEVAFEDFVRARSGSLLRTALLLTGQSRAEAEDLLQIALEKAYRHWPKICRSEEGPERCVRRILASASTDRWRRLGRRPERAMPAAGYGPVAPDRTDEIADRDYLLRALAALPPRQRAVLVLRYFDDLSEAETAQMLGCSLGTVKSQTARGLARLRVTADSATAVPTGRAGGHPQAAGLRRWQPMTDLTGLRAAMHAAVDGEQAAADELIRQVMQRHRRHRRHVALAAVAALIVLAVAVPAAIAVHGALLGSGHRPSLQHPTPRPHRLPEKMTGLPAPRSPDLRLPVDTAHGAAWYSAATRHSEPIAGLPLTGTSHGSSPPLGFGRLAGGWWATSQNTGATCIGTVCGPGPQKFYFIADGSRAATWIGTGSPDDGATPAGRAGAAWLVYYPPGAGHGRAQLVSTAGRPLSPRYTLPAGYQLSRGVGRYLLLSTDQNRFVLWDPRTGRVVRRFGTVIAAGPGQIAWTAGCRACRVQVLNLSTGKTMTTPVPGEQPATLTTAVSDDGQLIAMQRPGGNISIFDTASGTLTVIPGTALSTAEWQHFSWLDGGHQLIVTAGPGNQSGPAQLASWRPGDTHLTITTIRNPGEISELQLATLG